MLQMLNTSAGSGQELHRDSKKRLSGMSKEELIIHPSSPLAYANMERQGGGGGGGGGVHRPETRMMRMPLWMSAM